MDMSPKTKDGIVDINFHEESHVEEIFRELVQRFGYMESSEHLRSYLVKRIEEKVKRNELLFYEIDFSNNKIIDVTVEYGLERIHCEEVWLSDHQPRLHVYLADTNKRRQPDQISLVPRSNFPAAPSDKWS